MRSKYRKRTCIEQPIWLDQVLGCASPAFSSKNGGSPFAAGCILFSRRSPGLRTAPSLDRSSQKGARRVIELGWYADTIFRQINTGTEFCIFEEPWKDDGPPTIPPPGTKFTISLPNGARAAIDLTEVNASEGVIRLANGSKWRIESVEVEALRYSMIGPKGAPMTYWVVKESLDRS